LKVFKALKESFMFLRKSPLGATSLTIVALLAACFTARGANLHAQNTAMGQAEIYQTGQKNTFTVPEGVTRIRVFVYGAGGGAGSTISSSEVGMNGGSGAFVQAVLAVDPGARLTVIVGAGGKGGAPHTVAAGEAGGASEILNESGELLVSAGGGGGGSNCCTAGHHVGVAGVAIKGPAGSLLHDGSDGSACGGGSTRCAYPLPSFTADTDLGGRGFNNGNVSDTETIDGVQGYVYIEW
jgi:hypothetical protein